VGGSDAGTLAERWNGTAWHIQATPPQGGGFLFGVACPRASACIAVGSGSDASGTPVLLAQGGDGARRSLRRTAKRPGDRGALLIGVACSSPSSCVAVGESGGALAERWDGTAWRITPTPAGAAGSGLLDGVSCTSPSACIAVGTAFDSSGTPSGTIAERWDG